MLLGFPETRDQAEALATELGLRYRDIDLHYFPDGESKLRLPVDVKAHVFIYRSLNHPNDKLVDLLLASKYLRGAGVERLSLIAPYLCYMRQDMEFTPGEVVSQKVVGFFLTELFDDVITVDPHLHRISRLEEAVPAQNAIALTAAGLFARHLEKNPCRPILLGPDEESEQWVASIAAECGLKYAVARKRRMGDHEVSIALPPADFAGRCVVLVDDVASTGCTLAEAAKKLFSRGASAVDVLVTHALFVGGAVEQMRQAGIGEIASSDSVPHETNRVSLRPLLAESAGRLLHAVRNG